MAWLCHYAKGCFVAFLGDVSTLNSGWNMKKLFCFPALQLFHCLPPLFHCLPLWKTVRLHGKKLQNATKAIYYQPSWYLKNTHPIAFGFVVYRPKNNICYDFWKLHCALTFFGYLISVGHLPATILWQLTHINLIEFLFPLWITDVFSVSNREVRQSGAACLGWSWRILDREAALRLLRLLSLIDIPLQFDRISFSTLNH